MRRRMVLASIAGASLPLTAGCLGDDDYVPPEDCVTLADETGGSDEGDGLQLSSIELDETPEPLCVEVAIRSRQLTANTYPLLTVRVENAGSETVSWSQVGSAALSFPTRATTERVLLLGTEPTLESTQLLTETCIQKPGRVGRDGLEMDVSLDGGETLEQRYGIVGNNNVLAGECPPRETYRAEYEYGDVGTWGFEFELTE